MAVGVRDVLLYAVASAATIWILVPALAYSLGWTRIRSRTTRNRADAEPGASDPDYAKRFGQFAALGFEPAGRSRESCWFINHHKWYWRSRTIRWMAMPDGRMLVSFHRMMDDEPVRFGRRGLQVADVSNVQQVEDAVGERDRTAGATIRRHCCDEPLTGKDLVNQGRSGRRGAVRRPTPLRCRAS